MLKMLCIKKTIIIRCSLAVSVFLCQLSILVLVACYTNPEFDDPLCGNIQRSKIQDIKQVFFNPFTNGRFAMEEDTVNIEAFRYNFELEFEAIQSALIYFPGFSFALDCEPKFNVENISNISIILRENYDDFPAGTDISYLFLLPDGSQLSRFRDFSAMQKFFSLKLDYIPEKSESLETTLIIFLRSGDQIRKASTSPVLSK
ncbi:hypothetical protein [Indibacter alkaliphilus]|nr:hypothetical protein [Indibacter alkaliphilus]